MKLLLQRWQYGVLSEAKAFNATCERTWPASHVGLKAKRSQKDVTPKDFHIALASAWKLVWGEVIERRIVPYWSRRVPKVQGIGGRGIVKAPPFRVGLCFLFRSSQLWWFTGSGGAGRTREPYSREDLCRAQWDFVGPGCICCFCLGRCFFCGSSAGALLSHWHVVF